MKIKIMDIVLEKSFSIFLNFFSIIGLFFYLYYTGYNIQKIIPLTILYLTGCFLYYSILIYNTKKRLENLICVFDKLEKPFYMGDILKTNNSVAERVYGIIIKKACKAMLGTISEYEIENNDYRDFIEQWVHSIKAPISVIQLICNSNPTETNLKIQSEIQRIENETERILFFSKSRDFHNDYIIKHFNLNDSIKKAILANKSLLIENNAVIDVKDCNNNILSDPKWLQFIFSQLFTNSIKYKKSNNLFIKIFTEIKNEYIYIYYSDNGIGIPKDEINRIFDKGFTGSNGRKTAKSTGFGLYICYTLCEKLGIKISCNSNVGEGTTFILKMRYIT